MGAGISPTAMDLPPRGAGIEGSKVNFVLFVGRTSPRIIRQDLIFRNEHLPSENLDCTKGAVL